MEWESGSRRGPPSAPRLHGETLRQAGSWGKRRWSLAEKTSPRWLLPRRRHRCRSLHRAAGIVPVTSIPLLPLCTLGCGPGTEPSWGPAMLMPKFTVWVEVAIRMEWALQFCLLLLADMLGASLELFLLNYAWGECRDHSSSPGHSPSTSGLSGCAPVLPLPLAGSSLVTHSQALLPDPCLMQVDNSCLFLLCLENQMAPRLVSSCGRADT